MLVLVITSQDQQCKKNKINEGAYLLQRLPRECNRKVRLPHCRVYHQPLQIMFPTE
jgi:hypothetical protein